QYRIATDGTIDYSLIGQVKLEGMEPHAAGDFIATKLREKYLKHPQVSILVKEQPSKRITVMGQVAKPGGYAFMPQMSLVDAISAAGGFTAYAWKNHTTLTRVEKGEKLPPKQLPAGDIVEG